MKVHFLSIFFSLNIAAFGQTDLSGTWTLQSKQHILGPEYGNALPRQIKVLQQADSFVIETINLNGNGQEVSTRHSISMQGQSTTSTSASSRKYVKSLKWSTNKKDLVVTTTFYVPNSSNDIDFSRVETLKLSSDGKHLNFHKKSIETRSESWEVVGVYEKKRDGVAK